MFVYLDESGDLGFDFTKGGTSRFFVVTILVLDNHENNKALTKAIERTVKNKINRKKRMKNPVLELKGAKTSLSIKQYFSRQLGNTKIRIYSLILNKARVFQELQGNQERLYNFVSRLLIEKCPFREAKDRIILTFDKSKDQKEIREFNRYLLLQLQGILPINTPIEIYHSASHESKGIQAVDSFSWGIFRKYERKDTVWYEMFRKRIAFETVYLP